jgi:tetratricopeptide (TPR) repeat protein
MWGFARRRVRGFAGRRPLIRLWLAAGLLAALWPIAGAAQQSSFPSQPAAPKSTIHHPAAKAAPARKAATPRPPAAGKAASAEHSDYASALAITDPVAKAAALEAFLAKHPGSGLQIDALEHAMAAYQGAGNTAKVEESANRILALKPDNVRALAVVTYLRRGRATQGDQAALAELATGAQRGLDALAQWTKPADVADDTFAAMRKQMTAIFNGALGFATLQAKDYASARRYYQLAFAGDPNNLQDVYQLAIADLQAEPIEVDGLWYIAKATALAKDNEAARARIGDYGKARYKKYHGGEDGWPELVAAAAAQAAPPPDFAKRIKPAPSPAEIAVEAVREVGAANMSFSDWEFILSKRDASPANKEAAAKVWSAIEALQKNGTARLDIPVKIVAATKDTIQAAISEDNQKDNKVDLVVVLKTPAATSPPPGAMTHVVGVIVDYLASPFLFVMRDGELAATK